MAIAVSSRNVTDFFLKHILLQITKVVASSTTVVSSVVSGCNKLIVLERQEGEGVGVLLNVDASIIGLEMFQKCSFTCEMNGIGTS